MTRVPSTAETMFPDLPITHAVLAYALIDAGLCFLTCSENCRGDCVRAAEEAVRGIPRIPKREASDG